MEFFGRLAKEQVLHINDADYVIRTFFIYRKPRKFFLFKDINNLIIGTVNINGNHVYTGNHDIFCLRISKIEYVVDHLALITFDYTFLMTHIHDRS